MAPAEIQVPSALRSASQGRVTVPTSGGTVRAALRELADLDRSAASFLYRPDGKLRRSLAVFVNGIDVRNLEGEETPLEDGDVVSVAPSMAGG
ncbi:MAG TPA: MoaD/ThiS family protein [Thermoplasmata archaeon]|nr:MoaD/ThiS family protein [Thermoplasmata archaeon]